MHTMELVDADIAPGPGCRCDQTPVGPWTGLIFGLLLLAVRRR